VDRTAFNARWEGGCGGIIQSMRHIRGTCPKKKGGLFVWTLVMFHQLIYFHHFPGQLGNACHRLRIVFVCPCLASHTLPSTFALKGSGLLSAEPLTLSTPLVPCPSKTKWRLKSKAERYRLTTVPPKRVMSAASSVDSWGKTDLGSAGERACEPLFYRPVSSLSITHFSFQGLA